MQRGLSAIAELLVFFSVWSHVACTIAYSLLVKYYYNEHCVMSKLTEFDGLTVSADATATLDGTRAPWFTLPLITELPATLATATLPPTIPHKL